MSEESIFKGGCLCGSVQFEITPPTKVVAHCHCSMCRRAHGAAFATYIGVLRRHFSITDGRELVRWYRSSPKAERGFCSNCGSSMLFSYIENQEDIFVSLANISGKIDREPDFHLFYDDRADWCSYDDGKVKLGGQSGQEPLD